MVQWKVLVVISINTLTVHICILPVCRRADSDIGHCDWSVLVLPSTDREPVASQALLISRKLNGGSLLYGGVVNLTTIGGFEGYLEVYDIAGVFQESVDFVMSETLRGCTVDAQNVVTKLECSTPEMCVCVSMCV